MTSRKQWDQPPTMQIDPSKKYRATFATDAGDIEVELFADRVPNTVNNFVFLAREGFYDNTTFHRVIADFMAQAGDPTGTGTGGPGYKFNDETVSRQYVKGTLAMANAGPNTNGSQFFIVHGANTGLPPNYTIFGMVSSGVEVLDALANVEVKSGGGGERSTPVETQEIQGIDVTES